MAALYRDAVRAVLRGLPAVELRRQVHRLLDDAGAGFEPDAAAALADALEAAAPERDAGLLAELAGSAPTRLLVQARLLASWGAPDEAERVLDACVAALPLASPEPLALRARCRARRGDLEAAARDLRAALHLFPAYPFYVRTEKLVARVAAAGAPRRQVRLAVLSSATTALLAPVLRAALFRDRVAAELYEGAHGAWRQEILDPGSGLYAFAPTHVLLVVNHHDLALGPSGAGDRPREAVAELAACWRTLRERHPCHVVQTTWDLPLAGAWGGLESTLPDGRRRAAASANLELAAAVGPGVSLLDVSALPLPAGVALADERAWHASKQYPSLAALPAFADAVAAHVRASIGLASKALVLDLDNTLWGGIVGEDGVGGIRVGPPSAEGEAYQELQRFARDLKARGIVLAVCSKNNPADAEAPFRERDGMVLKLDDFAAFRANWSDKPSNLRTLAEELSLGLDSFVFLDDNPFERSLVRERVPEVTVPEVDGTPWGMLAALRRGLYFEAVSLTAEDLDRHRSYEASRALRTARQGGEALDDFLQGLGMTCRHGPVGPATLQRVTQLVNKTNQFNLTTRRYAEPELGQRAEDPAWWCRWFALEDRFGDHGLVGVVLARQEGARLDVDTWLMSCRVLGRGLERFMCACLLAAAAERGATTVRGEYIPTAKNELVRELYPSLGFRPDQDAGRFTFAVGQDEPPRAGWIRGVTQDQAAQAAATQGDR